MERSPPRRSRRSSTPPRSRRNSGNPSADEVINEWRPTDSASAVRSSRRDAYDRDESGNVQPSESEVVVRRKQKTVSIRSSSRHSNNDEVREDARDA